MREDDYTFCTYRGHNHTLARGVPMAPIFAELFGRGDRPPRRQGRLDAPDQRRAPRDGLVRDRRRPPADRPRRRLVGAVPQVGPGRGLLLRRRHDEHRGVPRGPQHGRGLEGPGRVRLREQPVHGVHADRRRDRRGAARPQTGRAAYGLEPIVVDGNDVDAVHEVARDGRRPGPRRRRAVAHRGAHVSPRRALAGRPRQVPPRRGGRRVEGARPAAHVPDAAARGSAWRPPTLDAIEAETREAVAAAEAIARAAPEPDAARARDPGLERTEARRGGIDVSRRRSPRASPRRCERDPNGGPDRRGRRARPAACSS